MPGRPEGGLLDALADVLGTGTRVLTGLLGLLVLAAASGILVLSQTATGRGLVVSLLEDVLEEEVDGRVEVGPVTGGNLLNRVSLAHLRISDEEGEPFVALEELWVEYSPLALLRGQYHFRRATIGELDLHLVEDREGRWNFERIFEGDDPGPPSDPIRLEVANLTLGDGRVEVRLPWTGSPDEEIWRLQEAADGSLEQVITAESLRGRFPLLRLSHPTRPLSVSLQDATARLEAVRQPLELRRFSGSAVFDDTVSVQLDDFRTRDARLSGRGWVSTDSPPAYRFDLDASRLSLAELQWLPFRVPEEGGGPARVVLRSPGDDLFVEVWDGDFRWDDSRATGDFVVRVVEPAVFESLDVRFDGVRLSLVDWILERETMQDGTVRGTATGSGPLDLMELEADLELRGLEDDEDRASRVRLSGGLGLEEPTRMRDLRVELERFEPRWTRVLHLDTRQEGRLDGELLLDREGEDDLAFVADVRHAVEGDSTSRVSGRGRILTREPGSDPIVDLSVSVNPLSLAVMDPYFPALDMAGVIRGDLSASGTGSDLDARADIRSPRGQVVFDGNFDLVSDRRRYDAAITARGIQLRQWIQDGPHSDLAVRGHVAGEGLDPGDMRASFDLEILPSTFEGADVDSSRVRFRVAEGLATVDTFDIRTELGDARGRGSFGTADDRSGLLVLEVDAPDLSRWNRWIVPGRHPVRDDAPLEDLFAVFPRGAPDADEVVAEEVAVPDTLSGSLRARGVLYGGADDYAFGGWLHARQAAYGDMGADSLEVTVDVEDARARDSLVVAGRGWGVHRGDLGLDAVNVHWARQDLVRSALTLEAIREGSLELDLEADITWAEDLRAADLHRMDVLFGDQRLRLTQPARLAYGEAGLSVTDFVMEGPGGGRLRAAGEIPDRGEARFDMELEHIELADLSRLFRLERALEGQLEGAVEVRGTAGSPVMEAALRVASPVFDRLSYSSLEADLRYRDRSLTGRAALRDAAAELVAVDGSVRADLSFRQVERRLLDDPLDLRVRADSLPLALVELTTEGLREVRGRAWGDVRVTGAPDALSLDGEARLEDGSARVVALDARYRDIRGRILFRGSEARIDSLVLASDLGGSGMVTGTVDLAVADDPGFALDLHARRLRAVDRRRASLVLDGRGHLGGSYRAPELTGDFQVSSGTIRFEEFLREEQVVDLTDPELFALLDTATVEEQRLLARAQDPFMQNLRAELTVTVGPDLWLRSSQARVELSGELDVRMDRVEGDVVAFGTLELVRGNYRWTSAGGAFSRQLTVERGQIDFVGTPGLDPNLDIVARHRTRTEQGPLVVRTEIGGTMLAPTLTLTSEPALSDSDMVCVLLFNTPCAAGPGLARRTLTGIGGGILGAVGGELTGLVGGRGGPDYLMIQQRPGMARDGVDDGVADDGALAMLAGTEVEVGWHLTPEVFLTFSQPLGNRPPAGSVDWRFADAWLLQMRTEDRFDLRLGGTAATNIDTDRLWGLFLFREWSF